LLPARTTATYAATTSNQVVLHGLRAPGMNGQAGRATHWDATEGRWNVALADGQRRVAIRPCNLALGRDRLRAALDLLTREAMAEHLFRRIVMLSGCD
jgi:phage major head subunit gpT-like protein